MADPSSVPATPDSDIEPFASPLSPDSAESTTPFDDAVSPDVSKEAVKKMPSLRSVSDSQAPSGPISASSNPLGVLSNARRPPAASAMSSGNLPPDLTSKMKAFALSRQGNTGMAPREGSPVSPVTSRPGVPTGPFMGGIPANFQPPVRPQPPSFAGAKSDSAVPKPRLGAKRGFGMKLSEMGGGLPKPNVAETAPPEPVNGGSKFKQFDEYIDTEKGYLTFKGKAIITSEGVDFSDGSVFRISLDQVEKLSELGKGNYGVVYKVRHSKNRIPRFGPGLSNFKSASVAGLSTDADVTSEDKAASSLGMVMAMKEIRLELDEAKLATILKELVILHECVSPYIIDFYGAFFQESAVYMCIEYMDGGSIDKLYKGGIPENVLRKITLCTILGLKELKEKHNIIHRDVKPTNILVNTRGQVKICDFGVSGNLVASIAKTNIGCQSYMAPERISGGSFMQSGASDGTYSVQSDIWSLGLTIIESAMGKYPYPPEVSSTIFSQLSAIVDGDPPDLPEEGYSNTARDFVAECLNKIPKNRPTYQMLLDSEWLKGLSKPETITEEDEEAAENEASSEEALASVANNLGFRRSTTEDDEVAAWVRGVLEKKASDQYGKDSERPALHTAPLDAVSNSPLTSPQLVR